MEFITKIQKVLEDNNCEIKFADSIKIKATPHTPLLRIITLFLTDNNICFESKDSDELMFLDEMPEIVEATIYQRLRLMKYNKQIN